MFLLVFWSPKQVKNEESYEESWAKLEFNCQEWIRIARRKSKENLPWSIFLMTVVAATFGALSEVQLMYAIYHFKAQEVNNPILQTVHNSELKRRSYSHCKSITPSWRKHFAKCCEITLLLRSDSATFLYSRVYFLQKLPDICHKLEADNLKVEANFAALRE